MIINCPHFPQCSGCTRNEASHSLESYIQAQAYFSGLGLPQLKLHLVSPVGWRCRAKLVTRGSSEKPIIGLYEKDSHHPKDIPFCKVHHPAINRAVEILRAWIISENIPLYDEQSGLGLLRYIQLAIERSTQKVQLSLILNCHSNEWHQEIQKSLLTSLWESKPELWHSLWINFNQRRDNVILGTAWELIYGEKWLWDKFLENHICFLPASFAQANLEMYELLLQRLEAYVPHGTDLLEYYAGVGSIGLSLIEKCSRLRCIEIVPTAQECFSESVRQLPSDLQKRVQFTVGSGAQHAKLLKQAECVVVDPPRKGLEPALLKALCEEGSVNRLIYVSCGWESFKRDCDKLVEAGWKVDNAEVFLFFPGTDQLETLAILTRK